MEKLLLIFVFLAGAEEVLVLLDSWDLKETHSNYFQGISDLGHTLTYKMGDSVTVKIEKHEEYFYSTIIFMCPSNDDLPRLSLDDVLKFSDKGGSVIVYGDTDAASFYRRLANEFGVDFYEQGSRLYSESKEKTLSIPNTLAPSIIVPSTERPIELSGIGLHFSPANKLLFPLLNTRENQYSRNEFKNQEKSDIVTVSLGFQSKTNNRAVFTGSIDICNNTYTLNPELSNLLFCLETAKWATKQKGKLRYSDITLYKKNEIHEPGYVQNLFALKDHVDYSIKIQEYKNGAWVDYNTDKFFIELNKFGPAVRKYLTNEKGIYFRSFQLPKEIGIYELKPFLNELGYEWLNASTKVVINYVDHNKHERFILAAYPYYISVFGSFGGFFVFAYYFLFNKNT